MSRLTHLTVAATLLFSACATMSNSQNDTVAEQRAIQARRSEMMALENGNDFVKALAFYSADAVIQAPQMPEIKGIAAIRTLYALKTNPQAPKVEGVVTSSTIVVAASGDYAYEHGTSRTTVTLPSGPIEHPGKHLIVWQKIDGVWHIAAISWSGDTPLRRAAASN